MFTIIGGDGKEYGPVTADQVRAWLKAGRANLETKARADGSDEWHRLGEHAEFSGTGELPPVIASATADPALAERWRRFFGALADGMIEALCWIPSSLVMMQAVADMTSNGGFEPEALMTAFWHSVGRSLPYLGLLLVVQAVLLSVRSQSLGNMLVGTRIVRQSDGLPGGFVRAFLLRGCLARVIRQIPLVGGIFWIVDSCFIFRDDRRCLHDLIAGTKVVKV
jgi:uncharacterized RDD family membrane protein YckC